MKIAVVLDARLRLSPRPQANPRLCGDARGRHGSAPGVRLFIPEKSPRSRMGQQGFLPPPPSGGPNAPMAGVASWLVEDPISYSRSSLKRSLSAMCSRRLSSSNARSSRALAASVSCLPASAARRRVGRPEQRAPLHIPNVPLASLGAWVSTYYE